ncbi:MAG: hypothetical protein KAU14_08275 [Thermoplasmata archaeon]|nr:hypothetical protein [Thermoplasmata archaeon]
METKMRQGGSLQVETMTREKEELGRKVYSEERNIAGERFRLLSASVSALLFLLLIVYVGLLHSLFMAVFALVVFGFLAYPIITGFILSLTGIHRLEVYENGLYPPYCPILRVNLRNDGFIPWQDISSIVANRQLRASKHFPYIVVNLKERDLAIPAEDIRNIDSFLGHIEPYVKVVREWEAKIGVFPVHYFPPSMEAKIDGDALLLRYPEREERLEFEDIKKVRVKSGYQLLTMKRKRIGLLGMGREDMLEIRRAHKRFQEGKTDGTGESTAGELLASSGDRKEG